MKKPYGIVITTSAGTEPFLQDCLNSILPSKYPILIVSNNGHKPNYTIPIDSEHCDIQIIINDWNGFELGGILRGYEKFDEFIHLQDTCVWKNRETFDSFFSFNGAIEFSERFMSYLGKYRSFQLERIGIPKIFNKREAILMETYWNQTYLKVDFSTQVLKDPVPIETEKFEIIHDERRMVCENDILIKYKIAFGGVENLT